MCIDLVEARCNYRDHPTTYTAAVERLEFDAYPTDRIVYMLPFQSADFARNGANIGNGEPWLLKPIKNDRFKLIACLLIHPHKRFQFYGG